MGVIKEDYFTQSSQTSDKCEVCLLFLSVSLFKLFAQIYQYSFVGTDCFIGYNNVCILQLYTLRVHAFKLICGFLN